MKDIFYIDYIGFFIYVIIIAIIVLILFSLSYILSIRNVHYEKLSAYECGFSPFSNSKQNFDVSFYIVGILLIIFDLELVLIWPWLQNINFTGFLGYCSVVFFLIILIVGFFFEWKQGALNWALS